jgi:hypothetical protein
VIINVVNDHSVTDMISDSSKILNDAYEWNGKGQNG